MESISNGMDFAGVIVLWWVNTFAILVCIMDDFASELVMSYLFLLQVHVCFSI